MQKFGFIYLWYDCKHKKFYVGRHWGTEDDGYICSSKTMREAYRRRPDDFKRRIISKVHDKDDLINEEQRWLNMIKPCELIVRYYNKTKRATTPSTKGYTHTEETRKKISESNRGKVVSEETKQRLSIIAKKQFSEPEQRKHLSNKVKENWQNEDYVKRVMESRTRTGITDSMKYARSENMKRINKLRWNKYTE